MLRPFGACDLMPNVPFGGDAKRCVLFQRLEWYDLQDSIGQV